MTYSEIQEFTKQVVLKYLPEIVQAEENNRPYPKVLTDISFGLPSLMEGSLFCQILNQDYKIRIY